MAFRSPGQSNERQASQQRHGEHSARPTHRRQRQQRQRWTQAGTKQIGSVQTVGFPGPGYQRSANGQTSEEERGGQGQVVEDQP